MKRARPIVHIWNTRQQGLREDEIEKFYARINEIREAIIGRENARRANLQRERLQKLKLQKAAIENIISSMRKVDEYA